MNHNLYYNQHTQTMSDLIKTVYELEFRLKDFECTFLQSTYLWMVMEVAVFIVYVHFENEYRMTLMQTTTAATATTK